MNTLINPGSNADLVGGTHNSERIFFAAMASVMLAVVLVGFAPSFYLAAFLDVKPLSPLVHVHGFLFTLWPILFIAQAMLIRKNRIELHRALGVAGAVLAVLMVISGYFAITADRPSPSVGSPAFLLGQITVRAALFGQIYALIVFATLVFIAIRLRHNSGVHKRLLLIATISILPAAAARILRFIGIEPLPHIGYLATWGSLLLMCAIYDVVTQRRLHPATLWGGLFVFLRHVLTFTIGFTDQWQAIAKWLTTH